MKAVIINRYGGPEFLEYTDIPRSEAQYEFLLEDVAKAHRLIEQRQHTGKIILTVHEEES